MRAQRSFVVDPRVGGHLQAALLSGPLLGGLHQRSANSLLSRCLVDEPALDETDWPRRVATVSVGAQSHLKKSSQCSLFIERDQDCHRESSVPSRIEDRFEFFAVLFLRRLGPQQLSHCCKLVFVGKMCLPHLNNAEQRNTPSIARMRTDDIVSCRQRVHPGMKSGEAAGQYLTSLAKDCGHL